MPYLLPFVTILKLIVHVHLSCEYKNLHPFASRIWKHSSLFKRVMETLSIYERDMNKLDTSRMMVTFGNRCLEHDYPKTISPLSGSTICSNRAPNTSYLVCNHKPLKFWLKNVPTPTSLTTSRSSFDWRMYPHIRENVQKQPKLLIICFWTRIYAKSCICQK